MPKRVRRMLAGFILCGSLGSAGWIVDQQVQAAANGWGPMIQQARAIQLPTVLLPTAPAWDAPAMQSRVEPGGVLVLTERKTGVTLREAVHPLSVGDPDVTKHFTLPEWGQIQSSMYHAPGGQIIQMFEGHRGQVYISLIVSTKSKSSPQKDLTQDEATELLNHLQLESVR